MSDLAVIRNTAGAVLPALIAVAGDRAALRFLEYFTFNVRNKNTRAAYVRASADFLNWCERQRIDALGRVQLVPRALKHSNTSWSTRILIRSFGGGGTARTACVQSGSPRVSSASARIDASSPDLRGCSTRFTALSWMACIRPNSGSADLLPPAGWPRGAS